MDESRDQNANRDIFNIGSVRGHVNVINQYDSPQRANTEKILINTVKAEIANRLEHSLINQILINLHKENQPNQVFRIWDSEIKTGTKVSDLFSPEASILSVFDRDDIAGSLLILGPPGCGKTVTMLDLAKALVKRAEQQNDYPIPVLFNLASWGKDNQSITDWLISELKLKYGVRLDVGRQLLEGHRILPFLDGLDELKSTQQEICALAINEFLSGEERPISIVVGSRQEEYEFFDTKLLLRSSISLKPLAYLQIRDYLTSVQREDLWKSIRLYDELLHLLSIPLFLNIAVLAEEELLVDEWRRKKTESERIDFLLNAYICRMFTRKINNYSYKGRQPSIEQTNLWLIWLAQYLQRESITDFLIEGLQPYLLKIKEQKSYIFLVKVLGRITYIVPGFFVLTGTFTIWFALLKGIIGFLVGISLGILGYVHLEKDWVKSLIRDTQAINFKFAESRTWSWEKAKERISGGKSIIFVAGLLGVAFASITSFIAQSDVSIILYAALETIVLDIYFKGISQGPEIIVRHTPNQGILNEYRSFRNTFFVFYCIVWSICTLIVFHSVARDTLIYKSISSLFLGFVISGLIAVFVLAGMLYFWIKYGGGKPCIQHFFLRYVLFKSGAIPWNYAQFLDYATERLFLQRIGGSYRFIHRMLQEHFSLMSIDTEDN